MNLHDRGTGAAALTDTVDLTNCDREPIHIPGAIQPFGFLLALSAEFDNTMRWHAHRLALFNACVANTQSR